MGAAIGGAAAGVLGLGGAAGGAYLLLKRRRARAQEAAALREQNVQMGAPEPSAATADQPVAPEQDFEYTV
jgi:hypothetical protein